MYTVDCLSPLRDVTLQVRAATAEQIVSLILDLCTADGMAGQCSLRDGMTGARRCLTFSGARDTIEVYAGTSSDAVWDAYEDLRFAENAA